MIEEMQHRLTTEVAQLWPRRGEWTEADYFALPDTNRFLELSEGDLVMPPHPTDTHQRIVLRLVLSFQSFVEAHNLGTIRFAPLPVRLWPDKIREPDILFVSHAHADRIGEQVYGPPDLVVEVVSASTRRTDRVEKFVEYARAGVDEYWLVADEYFAEHKEEARAVLLSQRIAEARAKRLGELRTKAAIVYPAEKAIPGAGAPLAVIDGVAIYPETIAGGPQHDFEFKNVSTPKERLEKFIDAFVVMREVEKTGLEKDPALKRNLSLERIELLSQAFIRAEADVRSAVSEEDLRAEYRRFYVPEVYQLQIIAATDRARLEEAHGKLRAGEPFDALAEAYNEPRLAKLLKGSN